VAEVEGHILVVDDDPINRMTLGATLQEQGFAVETGETGLQGLQKLREQAYDVVLLDLLMPEMDGFEVLDTIKRDPQLRHIPVIVISALEELDSVVRCIEMGATDYLCKPFDPVLLRARLNASLSSKRLHDMQTRYLTEIEELAQQLKVRNTFIKKTFGRYLSDEIVTSLLDSPNGQRLGGERRQVTVLMSDIRGFTAITERLQPEQVVLLLNNYLGQMAEQIIAHKGTIDEFLGDGILSLFGAPVLRRNDARRAVVCAIAMQEAMKRVNEINLKAGLPAIEMGIAVNTGDVVVGNIGSVKRTKFGAVGRNMNLTARIESFTVGGQVLISDATLREIGDDAVVGDSFTICAKGFTEPILVHELLGVGGEQSVALKSQRLRLVRLGCSVPAILSELDGKRIRQSYDHARITGISSRGAELRTSIAIEPLQNVKLSLPDGSLDAGSVEVYGKITAVEPRGETYACRMRFTSAPSDSFAFLERVMTRAGRQSD